MQIEGRKAPQKGGFMQIIKIVVISIAIIAGVLTTRVFLDYSMKNLNSKTKSVIAIIVGIFIGSLQYYL